MVLESCASGYNDPQEPDEVTVENQSKLSINIGTLEASGAGVEDTEKIKSLRIIMLSDGFVEYNNKIDFTDPNSNDVDKTAASFIYKFEKSTVPGNKKFYLFANEESVNQIKFEDIESLPKGINENMTLSDLLNHYTKEKLPSQGSLGYENSGSGKEFERIINAVYFQPDYVHKDNKIYLPYSSYYDGFKATDDPTLTIKATMYLVPVATKFTLNIKNYRRTAVVVEEILLKKYNTNNFLLAQLNEKEKNKYFNSKEYYWIDWLAYIARESNSSAELEDFNKIVGWMEEYRIPQDNTLEIKTLTSQSDKGWIIDKLIDKENPDKLEMILYYPESINIIKKEVYNSETNEYEIVDTQGYFAQFIVYEKDNPDNKLVSEWLEIDTIKTLFRDTHVILDVELYESLVEIFGEISNWKKSDSVQGFVEEKDDD